MPTKAPDPGTGLWRVTFTLPPDSGANGRAWLCGEFNDWAREATPLQSQADGSFKVTLLLQPGRSYRYRYYLGGERWENDRAADAYVDNEYGGVDSLVTVAEEPSDRTT